MNDRMPWRLKPVTSALVLAGLCAVPLSAFAQTANNPNPGCAGETVFYNPSKGEDVVVPKGYKIEVFAKNLNFPTDIAFVGDEHNFKVYVLESGTGLPGACNNNATVPGVGKFAANNPFTPDVIVLDKHGNKIAGPFGKPTATGGGLQPDGPAIGLAFEKGLRGGRLFVTDSNQGVRGAPGQGNNTSRIMTMNASSGSVSPFITGLPTGDHPTEQVLIKGSWIYWSQGSATNSGVTGLDNGAGGNQHEIACQTIKLSDNVFSSVTPTGVVKTSGYSNFGVQRPGATIPPFENATKPGMCTGAILRARIDSSSPADTVEPFSWGYRNPYGIRFAPKDHPLEGKLFVTENGEDDRGARPTNNAPDRLQIAQQNKDGSPDYHGWPDRFGFLESTQSVFNPLGFGDDPAAKGKPVLPVLAFPPQKITAPLGLMPADVAAVGLDFAPRDFTGRVVKRGAALVAREGDFGFSPGNGTPIEGHDIMLVNFLKNEPLQISTLRFAFNCRQADQRHNPDGSPACTNALGGAFPNNLRGINRPTTAIFGPDGALYLVDYGAVRDVGRSEPNSAVKNPANLPLVQMPGTGVIWRISRTGGKHDDDDHDHGHHGGHDHDDD